jgi:hypothetical protein
MRFDDAKLNSKVVVVNDIEGTGIKAGHEGRIIYIQNGIRTTGRSTDLGSQAFQVRFKGGAEIWLTSNEVELQLES